MERGGMGVVYKARQVRPNRIVALKMILSGQLASESDVQRFHNEAEAAAKLHHSGIVAVHEVGEHEGQQYFSMEYVEGQTLAKLIRANPLPARKAAQYVKAIAEAMDHGHQQGILHRDLKPSNVLIDSNDQPRITDFGLAKRLERDSTLTATGMVVGTPSYMPPEQALGNTREIGPASDVYALGAILYELFTGRPPFRAATVTETLRQVVENEPVSPRLLERKIPRDLETICLKCLQKDRTRRYHSAKELAADLGSWLSGVPIKARPVGRVERCWRWCRRNPIGAGLSAAILLLLVTVTFATILISRAIAHERQARVSREESIFLTHVVQQGNAIDNRFSDYEGPLEDLRASVTNGLTQVPPDDEVVYYADCIDLLRDGPVPPDLAPSRAHGKKVSIEHGTVAGHGCENAPKRILQRLMTLRHDFRRVFKRTMAVSRAKEAEPPTDEQLRGILAQEPSVAVPWMYYSQEEGIHYGYPGKGGYDRGYNPRDRPFYEPFLAAKPPRGLAWGKLYWDTQGLGLLLPCCAAIHDAHNDVSGIVGFDVRMETIREMLKINLPYFVKSWLVDAEWAVIVDSDMTGSETSRQTPPLPFAELVKETKEGGSWLVKTDSKPQKYVAVFPLHVKGWHYVVEADSDRLTKRALHD
jgi:tRNA A-37 threonylcarbamoyl transferase component Bud32